jgi:hypothetical protein
MGLSDYWNLAKGWFGYTPEQKVGKDLGGYLGQLGSEYIPIPGINGKQFGEWAGSFLPFKEGGFLSDELMEQYRQGGIGIGTPGYNPGVASNPNRQLLMPFNVGGRIMRPPPFVGSWDDFKPSWEREMLPFKQGGRIDMPLSYSNIRDQVMSEGMAPMKKGGRVKKRKH